TAFDELVGHVRRYDPDALMHILEDHALEVVQSAGFGMGPRNKWLRDFAVWGLTQKRMKAMRWYNGFLLPLALRLQRRLAWVRGMANDAGISDVLLVCEPARVAVPGVDHASRATISAAVGPE